MKFINLPQKLKDQWYVENGRCLVSEDDLDRWVFQKACAGASSVPAAEEIRDLYFPVLDHGFVALVDYMGGDAAIARAARTSYGSGNISIRDDRHLIRYLYNHLHTSPFEMCEVKLHVKLPIFVARQWIRHRTYNVNELSGRYSIMPLQMYTPDSHVVRAQSKSNKQGRGEEMDAKDVEAYLRSLESDRVLSSQTYVQSIRSGVARELSRIDLPLSLYTEWYCKVDLHNLMHFLALRCDSHAQWEIQQYAKLIAGMVKRIAPGALEAWIDYRFNSTRLSRLDMILLQKRLAGQEPVKEDALALGMTNREWDEFQSKLAYKGEAPDFTLNLEDGKSPEYFFAEGKKYVPEI